MKYTELNFIDNVLSVDTRYQVFVLSVSTNLSHSFKLLRQYLFINVKNLKLTVKLIGELGEKNQDLNLFCIRW